VQRVAVLGGGVAGLTAADELSQRHFQVDIFERRDQPGGKARSFLSTPLPGLGQLPAEHGFRFIPGFYRHLPDTMKNIPYQGNSNVEANLVEGRYLSLLRSGKKETVIPASPWHFHPARVKLAFSRHPFRGNFDLSHEDLHFIADRVIQLLSTCNERRLMELEKTSWWEYCNAVERSQQSPEYPIMMRAMTRTLVAARADEMSARTGGDILAQLQLAAYKFGGHPDRLLNGPTSDVWIEPWRQKLAGAGVNFYPNQEVTGFHVKEGNLIAVHVRDATGQGKEKDLTDYDWYVCALPVDVMQQLVHNNIKEAAPSLANLDKLIVRWMNGFMLYLRQDLPKMKGHCIYVDSPWALTSVSQVQFWTPQHRNWRIPGKVGGILSVDISDWDTCGISITKPARECSADEIRQEVIYQLRAWTQKTSWGLDLSDDNIAGYFIDPDIVQPNPGGAHINLEPLLVNTVGSWSYRPNSYTEIGNLFLASDYVRTYTDLATMEGANEAARRAVNCILKKSNSNEKMCKLWPLEDPLILGYKRFFDRRRFQRSDAEAFAVAKDMLEALRASHAH
jgi:15-cis-phytoene desaturase